MRTFNTIVCALDLYPAADRALPYAAALARSRRLGVELLTVIDDTAIATCVDAELERRADGCGLGRHEAFVVRSTQPAAEIVDHVTGRDGALLVIATTARGGSDERRLGTVTDEVLRCVEQPVLVVGPRAELTGGSLVVLVDDHHADSSLPAVERWSATFAAGGAVGARVVAVRAPDAWPEPVRDGPDRGVERYVGALGALGIVASGEVLRGCDPVVTVLGHLRPTDGVVVVTNPADAGEPTHWYDTVRRLIRFAPRPVLVVPVDRRPRPQAP